ncbi:MAG: aldehyde dehydrogenase [Pseudonocardiales bacterium]|nr:aldehyde dehydrogenase [Pseudonocardiales bacterium]
MPTQSVDPRTGVGFGPGFPDTTPNHVRALVALAAVAFPQWATTSDARRAVALSACAATLEASGGVLAALADSETALGVARLEGEVARAAFQFRAFADVVSNGGHRGIVIDTEVPGAPPQGHPELRRILVPVGPVAVFGASNFPFAFGVAGGDTASALAAGCPVVVKAHPGHPQTSQRTADLISDALARTGAPEGTLALVHGLDSGRQLILDARISAAAFTGSHSGGRALFDLAVSREQPIPFYGELGSVNPVVVLASALRTRRREIIEGYIASLTLGSGQFCTNPGLLIVPSGTDLVPEIASLVQQQPAQTMLNRGTRSLLEDQQRKVLALADAHLVAEGASARTGFATRVALISVPMSTALSDPQALATECFGPVGVVVEYDDPDDALTLISSLPGCLVGTVHADADDEAADSLVAALAQRSGRVVWNGWPTGVAVSPAQQHGGPYPASTNDLHTSVGTSAIARFVRPVAYQSFPSERLPAPFRPAT